jgi:hypothetical protein
MDTEEIKQTTETKHLGIKRNNKNNIDIEDRIKLARRTIYALLPLYRIIPEFVYIFSAEVSLIG